MGVLGTILAELVVALLRYAQERQDFKEAVLASVQKESNAKAMAALRYLADDHVPQLRVRAGARDIDLSSLVSAVQCPAAYCPLRK